MAKPICTQKSPYVLACEKKKYAWCACGKSAKQPFCDGTHSKYSNSSFLTQLSSKSSNANYSDGCL